MLKGNSYKKALEPSSCNRDDVTSDYPLKGRSLGAMERPETSERRLCASPYLMYEMLSYRIQPLSQVGPKRL